MKLFKKISFFYREDMPKAKNWEKRLTAWFHKNSPKSVILPANIIPQTRQSAPELLIVLGGDGTILEASQKYQKWNPLIFGLNLGHVGFLASVRDKNKFLSGLKKLIRAEYRTVSKMMLKGLLVRNGKTIHSVHTLNDILVQSIFRTVKIKVSVDNHPVQYIHGTGALISTATGSTAYNLSAHGPIVMPDIKCMIVTEIMDHNLPTPSLVIKKNRTVSLLVENFRKKDEFIIAGSKEKADVIFTADNVNSVPVHKGDLILVKKSPRLVRFAELDKNYFFKSLEEKFAFR